MMLTAVLTTEFMKLRRCKVTWATLGGLSMGPLGIALFMWIVREPGRAAQMGLLGTKANLAGLEATWPSYLSMLTLIVGIGGMILLAFIVAYVFGREYDNETAKNMLALPVGRHWFVVTKLAVTAVWWVILVAFVLVESIAIGFALGLPGFSAGLVTGAVVNLLVAAGLSYLLVPVIAWITVWGRGNTAPIGFAIAMLALGNLFGKTGWAVWFPWSIVPLLIGMVADPVETLPAGSYVILALTFVMGIAATTAQLRFADNAQ
ncbi:MAG: ABC transporter permease [Coriobacteriia bacterium]|nr:ABC transporter permease [Coriobacteriia bacterium]